MLGIFWFLGIFLWFVIFIKFCLVIRGNFWYYWVFVVVGWIVGVIVILLLLVSVLLLIWWIIKVLCEFINDYLFNFFDINFVWFFVLVLLVVVLMVCKCIVWLVLLVNMVLVVVVNVVEIVVGGNIVVESFGENFGFVVYVVVIVVLVLGYWEFWVKVCRGVLFWVVVVWFVGVVVGIVVFWGLVELFLGLLVLDEWLGYVVNWVVGFVFVDFDLFIGRLYVFFNVIFGLFGVFVLIGVVIVLFLF